MSCCFCETCRLELQSSKGFRRHKGQGHIVFDFRQSDPDSHESRWVDSLDSAQKLFRSQFGPGCGDLEREWAYESYRNTNTGKFYRLECVTRRQKRFIEALPDEVQHPYLIGHCQCVQT